MDFSHRFPLRRGSKLKLVSRWMASPGARVRLAMLLLGIFHGWSRLRTIPPFHPTDTETNERFFVPNLLTGGDAFPDDSTTNEETLLVHNVLLMGQFNYDPYRAKDVKDWVLIWSRYFSNILVTGPFSVEIGNALDELGIQHRHGRADSGVISPYENLGRVARELLLAQETKKNTTTPRIDAVLYMHDDILLNMTYFRTRNGGVFPTDRFLWNHWGTEEVERQNTYFIQIVHETWENGTVRTFSRENNSGPLFTDGLEEFEDRLKNAVIGPEYPWSSGNESLPFRVTFSKNPFTMPFSEDDPSSNQTASTPAEYLEIADKLLSNWPWFEWCMKHHLSMLVEGPRDILDDYAISVEKRSVENKINGAIVRSVQVSRQFLFISKMQSDFTLVPMEWADEFSRLASVFAEHYIFLESAVPTMIRWMMARHQKQNVGSGAEPQMQAQSIPLCTTWDYSRDRVAMIDVCLGRSGEGMGVYHPFKLLTKKNKRVFRRWQKIIQRPVPEIREELDILLRHKPRN